MRWNVELRSALYRGGQNRHQIVLFSFNWGFSNMPFWSRHKAFRFSADDIPLILALLVGLIESIIMFSYGIENFHRGATIHEVCRVLNRESWPLGGISLFHTCTWWLIIFVAFYSTLTKYYKCLHHTVIPPPHLIWNRSKKYLIQHVSIEHENICLGQKLRHWRKKQTSNVREWNHSPCSLIMIVFFR